MICCKNVVNVASLISFFDYIGRFKIHLFLSKLKFFLIKVLYIKVKISWNNTVGLMNSIKKYNGPINNNKNKLNSKIS